MEKFNELLASAKHEDLAGFKIIDIDDPVIMKFYDILKGKYLYDHGNDTLSLENKYNVLIHTIAYQISGTFESGAFSRPMDYFYTVIKGRFNTEDHGKILLSLLLIFNHMYPIMDSRDIWTCVPLARDIELEELLVMSTLQVRRMVINSPLYVHRRMPELADFAYEVKPMVKKLYPYLDRVTYNLLLKSNDVLDGFVDWHYEVNELSHKEIYNLFKLYSSLVEEHAKGFIPKSNIKEKLYRIVSRNFPFMLDREYETYENDYGEFIIGSREVYSYYSTPAEGDGWQNSLEDSFYDDFYGPAIHCLNKYDGNDDQIAQYVQEFMNIDGQVCFSSLEYTRNVYGRGNTYAVIVEGGGIIWDTDVWSELLPNGRRYPVRAGGNRYDEVWLVPSKSTLLGVVVIPEDDEDMSTFLSLLNNNDIKTLIDKFGVKLQNSQL